MDWNTIFLKAKVYRNKDFQQKWDAYVRYINGIGYGNQRLTTEKMKSILEELGMRPRSFTQRELKIKWLTRTHQTP